MCVHQQCVGQRDVLRREKADDVGNEGDCLSTFGGDVLCCEESLDCNDDVPTSFLPLYTPSASKPSPPSLLSAVVPDATQM